MRIIPIRQSLLRHALVMGAERDLTLYAALIAFLVGLGGFTLISALAGLVFWTCAHFALRQMAKVDPQMSQVWMRHIRQQDYYPARTGVWRD